MTDYLPDATNFDDIPVKENPVKKFPDMKGYRKCLKCMGHGKWNLRTNCYRRHKGTPKQYAHFQGSCGACWGWGWIPKTQTCMHEWRTGKAVGRCLNEWVCKKCKKTRVVDSSD